MRHRQKKGKLGRLKSHREALVKNLVADLIMHESLQTTHDKAKVTSAAFDRLMNKVFKADGPRAKKMVLHNYLNNKEAEKKAYSELVERFKERKTGLTRVLKIGYRQGDNSPLSQIELV